MSGYSFHRHEHSPIRSVPRDVRMIGEGAGRAQKWRGQRCEAYIAKSRPALIRHAHGGKLPSLMGTSARLSVVRERPPRVSLVTARVCNITLSHNFAYR